MSTSDWPGTPAPSELVPLVGAPAAAPPTPATPAIPAAPEGLPPRDLEASTIARAVERLANDWLSAGPSAMHVGAGGASPAVFLPPVPGPVKSPPLVTAPPPKESDLRALPTILGDQLGLGVPLAIATPPDASADVPYYLAIAGLPSPAAPHAAPRQAPAQRAPSMLRSTSREPFDANVIRSDFPILRERVNGRRLIWLDNGATTQKPQVVIDRVSYFYEKESSNVHRGAHTLAARATDAYEAARDKVRRYLNAPSPKEIVFVRGTTEGINLVAQSWGRQNLGPEDEIVITWLEHHANIVPWQQLCFEKGCKLRVAPVDDRGDVILEAYERLLTQRTRLVSITHVSNALGTILPVKAMTEMAHRYGALVHVDGAQAVAHLPVDVQAIDCDFYTFSGHKVFAPTGIGVVFGRQHLLDAMPPWQGGGNMITDVTFERTTYQPAPGRFEAGTGNIADAVGLGAALDYVTQIGLENIAAHEHELLLRGTDGLLRVPGLRVIGTAPEKVGVLSFIMHGLRSEDIGSALNEEGIAVRAGHHCAQPILRRFGVESTVRATLAPYNTRDDVDALVDALLRLRAAHPSH